MLQQGIQHAFPSWLDRWTLGRAAQPHSSAPEPAGTWPGHKCTRMRRSGCLLRGIIGCHSRRLLWHLRNHRFRRALQPAYSMMYRCLPPFPLEKGAQLPQQRPQTWHAHPGCDRAQSASLLFGMQPYLSPHRSRHPLPPAVRKSFPPVPGKARSPNSDH